MTCYMYRQFLNVSIESIVFEVLSEVKEVFILPYY